MVGCAWLKPKEVSLMQLLKDLFMLVRALVAVLLAFVAVLSLCGGLFVLLKAWDDPQWMYWLLSFFSPAATAILLVLGVSAFFKELSLIVAPAEWRRKMW